MDDSVFITAASSVTVPESTSSIEAEPRDENDLYIAETVEVVSTDESIICLDEDEFTEKRLPAIPLPDVSFVPSVESPLKEDDDDFSIIFEKRVPPPEVEVLENYISPQIQPRRRFKRFRILEPSDQSAINGLNVAIRLNPALDDSVNVVETVVNTTPSTHRSTTFSTLRQAVFDSTEKKKRKIECGVCFDGPDEIEKRGISVVSTVCGHIFCKNCITESIKSLKQCPQCRKKLTMKQFHNIYV